MASQLSKWVVGVALAFGFSQVALATDKVTVFAAASLTNALGDIVTQYEKGKEVKIVTSFASSSTLARQMEQGAPANLFISADQQWMDYVTEKKLINEKSRITLLGNELVLVAPKVSKLASFTINKQTDWQSLLNGERLAVGDPDHVPAGIYAKEALTHLGVWDQLSPQMARANNVRSALVLVERDEAPLGIVYGSDAVASDKVKIIAKFPEDSHKPVEYPMALIGNSTDKATTDFYTYLKGPEATAVFKHYGFSPKQ